MICEFYDGYNIGIFSSFILGVCTNATAPSVSSINRILRNRAAERAAAEFARAAGYGLYPPAAYNSFAWAAGPHMWPQPHMMPQTTPVAIGSPGSGSQDTAGSPEPRMIGE